MPDHVLEEETLRLVNRLVHDQQSRSYLDRVRKVTGLDLPLSDVRLIVSLHDRSTSVSEAAAGIGVDIAQVSRQAVRLDDLGLVYRTPDPSDRRRVLLSLSPVAQDLVDRWLRTWLKDYTVTTRTWPDEDINTLSNWFRYVHDRLSLAVPWAPRDTADRESPGDAGQGPSLDHDLLRLALWIQRSRGFNDLLASLGVPLTQHAYFTLWTVQVDGPLSIGEVAAEMGMDHSQASKRVSQLHRAGLVQRSTGAVDRRSSVVSVSDQGRDLLETIRATQLIGLIDLLVPTDAAARRAYEPVLRRYVEALHAIGEPAMNTY